MSLPVIVFPSNPIPTFFLTANLYRGLYFFFLQTPDISRPKIPKSHLSPNFLTCFGSRFKKKKRILVFFYYSFIGGFQQNNYYLLHKHPRVAIFFLLLLSKLNNYLFFS